MREKDLAERLIAYETSSLEGIQSAAGFVKGWLEARDVEVGGGFAVTGEPTGLRIGVRPRACSPCACGGRVGWRTARPRGSGTRRC